MDSDESCNKNSLKTWLPEIVAAALFIILMVGCVFTFIRWPSFRWHILIFYYLICSICVAYGAAFICESNAYNLASKPLDLISTAHWIGYAFVFALVIGVIIPGYIASHQDVFSMEDLLKKMEYNATNTQKIAEALEKNRRFEFEKTNLEAAEWELSSNYFKIARSITNIGTPGTTNTTYDDLQALHDAIQLAEERQKNLKLSVQLQPFYPYVHINAITPVAIVCFAILLTVMPPKYSPGKFAEWRRNRKINIAGKRWSVFSWWVFFSSVLILYRAPMILRNLLHLNTGRTVFAYSNIDIDQVSFVVTDLIDSFYILPLFLVWAKWFKIGNDLEEGLSRAEEPGKSFEYATDAKVIRNLTDLWIKWQVTSVLIAIPFIGSTVFYYGLMFADHDHRYLPQALNSHVLWAVTWLVISFPLLRSYYVWFNARTRALAAKSHNDKEFEHATKFFDTIQPLTRTNFVVSAFLGLASFLYPLFEHLLK